MSNIIFVNESGDLPRKVGKRWLVTIAKPGKGATGTYSADVLKETGPKAFPAGTKSFFTHDGKRDPRDMVGTFKEAAFWNEDEQELQSYLTPFPRYEQVLDEAAEAIEASIHAAARKDLKTNYVKELVYDRSNTVDLVAFAGLEGSGLKHQVEELFAAAAADSEQEEERENKMTFEITETAWNAQSKLLSDLTAKFDVFVAESKAAVQGVADEAAVQAAVDAAVEEALAAITEKETAIDAADVPAKVKESLKLRARKGDDITDALADAVSIVAEAKAEFAPDPKASKSARVVVVSESKTDSPKSYRVEQW